MVAFIDDHRDVYGVAPICAVLQMAPSTYYAHKARQRDPSPRARRDRILRGHIRRVWQTDHCVYGARKVWRALRREGHTVARCTVERLMRQMGLEGVRRGRAWTTTTGSDPRAGRPVDLVDRDFTVDAPNRLWVADYTFVATWHGFVYTAFVIDAYARRIVGWRCSTHQRTEFVLDALEQAIHDRTRDGRDGVNGVIHHSDAGSQYLAIRYGDRLVDAGINPSVGSVGDSYDNSLAETIIGLYKTEVVRRRGPWRTIDDVEFATLEWVHWFNTRRLFGPIGYVPPAEHEANYYAALGQLTLPGLN